MTTNLRQMLFGNRPYYTDGSNFYTSHLINNPSDGFHRFAAQDLGINKTSGFTPDEMTRINDLAGGINTKTKYLVLKNNQANQIVYKTNGLPDIKQGDTILGKVEPSTVPGLVRHSCSSYSIPGPVCSACNKPFP